MKPKKDIHKKHLKKAMQACVENGERLLHDAEWLSDDGSTTAVALCILAQEEFAKSFLLYLIHEGIIPWTSKVCVSLHDHRYKQLFGLIMEWLSPSDDEFIARIEKGPIDPSLPQYIVDAIKLYVKKVQPQGHIACPPTASDPGARDIAYGNRDNMKQDALYVRLSKDGEVISVPTKYPPKIVKAELDKAQRLNKLVSPLREGELGTSLDYHLFLETIKFLLLEKRERPFLIFKESKFAGSVTAPNGVLWPYSIELLVENISYEQATCVSGNTYIFLDTEIVRPSFTIGPFVVEPHTSRLFRFFLSEETYSNAMSPSHELRLYTDLEYHGEDSSTKYHISIRSKFDPSIGTFREELTDLFNSINSKSRKKRKLETKWMWPIKTK